MPDHIDSGLRTDLAQLRSTNEESLRRVSDCELKVAVNATKLQAVEERLLALVTMAEFLPVKWAVYGIVGSALAAVMTALLAGIIANGSHTGIR